MTNKKPFIPSVNEDLNREHKLTLKEGQISTILYVLEGYIQGSDDYHFDDNFKSDVDNIFERLEGVIDKFYTDQKEIVVKLHESQLKQPKPE